MAHGTSVLGPKKREFKKLSKTIEKINEICILGVFLVPFWDPLGPSRGPFGPSWTVLEALGRLRALLAASWDPLGSLLGLSWGSLGAVLGSSQAVSGPSWAVLGPSWAVFGPFWGPLGPSWDDLWSLLGRVRPFLARKGEN